MGLGKKAQGIPCCIESTSNISPFGLRYKPTEDDKPEQERRVQAKVKARAKGIPCNPPIKPYTPTLNGMFIRDGESTPYHRFLNRGMIRSLSKGSQDWRYSLIWNGKLKM